MPTAHPDIFNRLSEPFDPADIKVLPKGKGMQYVTARTVMNRLDDVLGPENWEDEYVPGEKSVLCKLTIELPGGKRITKCDAGGYAGMADQGDDDKSGFSDAFKRAAVKFGVGRFLYRDGFVTHEMIREAEPPAKPPVPSAKGLFSKEHVERTQKFTKWLGDRCRAVNNEWLNGDGKEHGWPGWTAKLAGALENGLEVPEKVNDFMPYFKARGHLWKWAIKQGLLTFEPGVDVEEAKTRQIDAYVAFVGINHFKTMEAELDAYIVQEREKACDAIYRKHPDIAPVGWVDEHGEIEPVTASASNGDGWDADRE